MSTLETIRSAEAATVVVAVPLSLPGIPSAVFEVTVAVFVSTVPAATDALTFTTRVKTVLPTANDGLVDETVPPEPTAGVVLVQPLTVDNETKVVPTGKVSLHEALVAASGPLLVTVMV